jgi:hypothetical protein
MYFSWCLCVFVVKKRIFEPRRHVDAIAASRKGRHQDEKLIIGQNLLGFLPTLKGLALTSSVLTYN